MIATTVSLLLAFHAPASQFVALRASPTMGLKDGMKGGFWNRPDFIESQKQAAMVNPTRNPTIAEGQPTGDTAHPKAFWKQAEWQAKSAAAAKENNAKYGAGSGLWPDGVPKDGVTYVKERGQSGYISK